MTDRFICDCGAVYSSLGGIDACQMNNHGKPTAPPGKRELVEALREARDWAKDQITEAGGCDHSVGICWCPDWRMVEHFDDLIARYDAEKGP